MLEQGMADDAIVAVFVKEQGLSALAAPPAEGFNLLGWVMPFIALAGGLGVIWLYIKRFRKPVEAVAPPLEPAVDQRYRERIEKELSEE
jgi:cytochrome c-type biogenesis protein CcmH/NrfF